MYFYYAPRLNPPEWIQQAVLEEIDSKSLIATSMVGGSVDFSLQDLLETNAGDVQAQEQSKETYHANKIFGFNLTQSTNEKIMSYYADFLQWVPDTPKLTIVKMASTIDYWKMHIDNLKTSSLFCLIKNSHPARTTWWEPNDNFATSVRETGQLWKNKKGHVVFNHKCIPKAAMWAEVGEMILFDNNSVHSIDEMTPGSDRYIMTIGFINISHDQLVECYHKWADSDLTNT
jgi:hypothetical protein